MPANTIGLDVKLEVEPGIELDIAAVLSDRLACERLTQTPLTSMIALNRCGVQPLLAVPDRDCIHQPLCFKVNIFPATRILPFLLLPVALAATVKPTAPLPTPDEPDVMVIHSVSLTASHAQLLVVDTFTLAEPLPTEKEAKPGEIV